MWEQIQANRLKSVLLVMVMAGLLVVLGYIIGEAVAPGAGWGGLTIAGVLWIIMTLISYFAGGRMLMAFSGAKSITRDDNPQLYNIVEEMTIASGLKKIPDIYIIDADAPNAFATGRDPNHAAVAVTSGLLARLNRDQLQGVIAHEIGHVVNRDILFMTLISVMVGVIAILSDIFVRSLFFGGMRGRRSRSSSRGGGQGQAIMFIVALVAAILAPILARIIYLAASRQREYLADASAAVYTRYPEGLASALEIIAGGASTPLPNATAATAPMYIVNPLKARAARAGLFSTHPPIENRIQILRNMAGKGEVSFKQYDQALSATEGSHLPKSALGLAGAPMRAAASETEDPKRSARAAQDTVRRANQYQFLTCACGLKAKLPPNFKHHAVRCPRCGATLPVDMAAQRHR